MPASLMMMALHARVHVLAESPGDLGGFMARLNKATCATCPSNRFIAFLFQRPRCGLGRTCGLPNAGHNRGSLGQSPQAERGALEFEADRLRPAPRARGVSPKVTRGSPAGSRAAAGGHCSGRETRRTATRLEPVRPAKRCSTSK